MVKLKFKFPKIPSSVKLEIATILREEGKAVAIEVGCTILQEKFGLPRAICRRTVKSLIKKLQK